MQALSKYRLYRIYALRREQPQPLSVLFMVVSSRSVYRRRQTVRLQGTDETHRADHEKEQEQIPA